MRSILPLKTVFYFLSLLLITHFRTSGQGPSLEDSESGRDPIALPSQSDPLASAKVEPSGNLSIDRYHWTDTATKDDSTFVLVKIPETNCEIRVWYNYQVIAISRLNEHWIEQGHDLETRAHMAYETRHNARVNARFMMKNRAEVAQLQARDQAKYGNPDGPTFDYLMTKCINKGLNENQCFQDIIDSSSRVNQVYNKECQ